MTKFYRCVLGIVVAIISPSICRAQPLELSRVLSSALQSHPKLLSGEAKLDSAQGDQLSAAGAFDLKLYAQGTYFPVGKYSQPRAEIGLKQPTTLWGAELYAKYQNGADFAPYDGALVTSEAGKASLGILVPLVQGRAIDQNRLRMAQAAVEVTIAEETLRSSRADVLASAANAWWKWVVLGKKLEIYRLLLGQAKTRQQFLVEQVKVGAIARIEAADNDRLVAQRQAKLVALEWEFRQQALNLSLYCRDKQGNPLSAASLEAPELAHITHAPNLNADSFESELRSSPIAKIYLKTIEVLDTELRLAKNDQLPRIDLEIFGAQSFGDTRPYSSIDSTVSETAVGGKLSLSLDLQRRKARGKAHSLRAKKAALEQDLKLFLETLRVQAEASASALRAQHEVTELNQVATSLAQQVTDAESESLKLGQSSILAVNLREQAQASAYLSELDSLSAFHLAWVELQRVLGKQQVIDYLPPRSARNTGEFNPTGIPK